MHHLGIHRRNTNHHLWLFKAAIIHGYIIILFILIPATDSTPSNMSPSVSIHPNSWLWLIPVPAYICLYPPFSGRPEPMIDSTRKLWKHACNLDTSWHNSIPNPSQIIMLSSYIYNHLEVPRLGVILPQISINIPKSFKSLGQTIVLKATGTWEYPPILRTLPSRLGQPSALRLHGQTETTETTASAMLFVRLNFRMSDPRGCRKPCFI